MVVFKPGFSRIAACLFVSNKTLLESGPIPRVPLRPLTCGGVLTWANHEGLSL